MIYTLCIRWIINSKHHITLWDIHIYYIPNFKRPITSHHFYHVTIQYLMVVYGCYWTEVIEQLSAVVLPCKVNDKSRWPRKASEWGAGSFRLIVCKQNTSVNILFIMNNIITYALRIVLINWIEKDIWFRALETKQNMNNSRCTDVRRGLITYEFPLPWTISSWLRHNP